MNGFRLVSRTNTLSHAVFFFLLLRLVIDLKGICLLISANERHIGNYLIFFIVICPFLNCFTGDLLDRKIKFHSSGSPL